MPIVTAREMFGIESPEALRVWLIAHARPALVREGRWASDAAPFDQPAPSAPPAIAVAPLDDIAGDAPPAIAYVNEGRWVADCPTAGCGGAIAPLSGAPFWCPYCLSVEVRGRWRLVMWPDERAKIEALLMARLLARNRNWWPGESIEALAAENIAAGIGA